MIDGEYKRKLKLECFEYIIFKFKKWYEEDGRLDYSDMTFTEAIFCIVKYITDNFYKPDELLNEIFAFGASIKVNIMWHIQEKMKYNQLRSYKHGNKAY